MEFGGWHMEKVAYMCGSLAWTHVKVILSVLLLATVAAEN
jgi:hypothetical protein